MPILMICSSATTTLALALRGSTQQHISTFLSLSH